MGSLFEQHKIKKTKIKEKVKENEEKLAKIHIEEELKTYLKIKEAIINEAINNTEVFSLKLEKWLELMFTSENYKDKPNEPYEKTSSLILVVDFEKPGLATKIIKHLNNYHIKNTLESIESLSKITSETVQTTLREFYNNFMTPDIIFGGKTTSNDIIKKSFGEKEKQLLLNLDSKDKFEFISSIDAKKLKEFIINENPAVAAFILNHCSENKILDITKKIQKNQLQDIISNLVHVKPLPNEFKLLYEIELKDKLFIKDSDLNRKKAQIQKASTVFETLPNEIRGSIFGDLKEKNPELLNSILSEMFVFEDIKFLEDVDIQSLIFEIRDMEVLATALLNAPEDLIKRFNTNFSERFKIQYINNADKLKEQTINENDITLAQSQTIRTLRQLEKNGRVAKR